MTSEVMTGCPGPGRSRRVGGVTKAVQDLMIAVERVHDAVRAALVAGGPVAHLLDDAATLELLPAGTGAAGPAEIERFGTEGFVVPDDAAFRRVSRTGDRFRVADEEILSFTHDREMPWLLPGVAPTGRRAEILLVTLTTVKRGRVARMRMLADGVALAEALGLAGGLGLEPAATARPAG